MPGLASREALAERLKSLRRRRGVSQEQLARSVGVTAQVVHNWERGHSGIPADELPAISEALGVAIPELYGESPDALQGRLDRLTEQLRRALELGPEHIEVRVFVRQEPDVKPDVNPGSELRDFEPTRADQDLRDVLQLWAGMSREQRHEWLDAARQIATEETT